MACLLAGQPHRGDGLVDLSPNPVDARQIPMLVLAAGDTEIPVGPTLARAGVTALPVHNSFHKRSLLVDPRK